MSSTLARHSEFSHVEYDDLDESIARARLAGVVGSLVLSVAAWTAIVVGVEAILQLV